MADWFAFAMVNEMMASITDWYFGTAIFDEEPFLWTKVLE
jgi:hypothetical protein